MGVRSHFMPQQSIVLHRLLRKYAREYPRHADTLAMTESSHAPFLLMKSGWSFTHSMGQETIVSFYVQEIFSAECHISKTMHTCASPFVGVMAELSKPMTAMFHPLLSCTFKFSEIFDGCVPSSLASQVCNPAPPVKLVHLAKLASAASAIRPMSIVHESLALLKATGASAHHRHENDTSVQSNGSRSVGMVLVGAVLDVHSKKSWPPVCEKMLLNMPVMTTVRFA